MQKLLEQAANLFQVDPSALSKLTGGNFSQVYGFEKASRAYVLRITPPNPDIDQPAMESILHWMQYLANHGMSVPEPLQSKNANLVEIAEMDREIFLISAVEKAPGVLAETMPFKNWNEQLFEELGRVTGQMHAISSKYTPPEHIRPRPPWDQSMNTYNPSGSLDPGDIMLTTRQTQIMQAIQKLPRTQNGYGLIHGDLHGANFFVDKTHKHITLFDFDDCCYGWYAMDIALPLLDLLVLYPGIKREQFAARFLTCFLKGYLLHYPLEEIWLYSLPDFLTLLEIALYIEVNAFAENASANSWVGKFMLGRKEGIEKRKPFVALDIEAVLRSS